MTEFKDKTFLEVLQTYIYEVERVTGQKPLELYLDCRLEDFFYHDLNRLCLAQYSKCKPEKSDSKFIGINIISLREFQKLQAENAELKSKFEIAVDSLKKISSGLTTDQSKVGFKTKNLAYQTLKELEAERG